MASAAPPSARPDSTREVAVEDFLFHLYRGSELLQENRVLEAKEELEFALTMQPLDAKGQDLLAAVYFRLGLYPRAIQIYENLVARFPRDTSVRINLALAYLKTGQPEPARQVLREALNLNPEHKRAWGYLGLALQKLGELEQAQLAFERGGHPLMAKRVTERRRSLFPLSSPPAAAPAGVREAAEAAFSELDAGELRFALAEPEPARPREGPWHTVEPGEASSSASTRLVPPPPPVEAPAARPMAAGLDVPLLLASADESPVTLRGAGAVVVRTGPDPSGAFAGRLDAIRVVAGTATTRVLQRRIRDAETSEVLGGVGSPLVRISGGVDLVLAARPGQKLALFALHDDVAFLREDLLLGFETRLSYESGRIAAEGGDGPTIVQLRGTGAVVLDLPGPVSSVRGTPTRPLLVRREWLVGWLGRMMARALPPDESPSGQRGLVALSGEGTALVCGA